MLSTQHHRYDMCIVGVRQSAYLHICISVIGIVSSILISCEDILKIYTHDGQMNWNDFLMISKSLAYTRIL